MDIEKFEKFVRSQQNKFNEQYQSMYTQREYNALIKMQEYSTNEFKRFYEEQHKTAKREELQKKLCSKIEKLKEKRTAYK